MTKGPKEDTREFMNDIIITLYCSLPLCVWGGDFGSLATWL